MVNIINNDSRLINILMALEESKLEEYDILDKKIEVILNKEDLILPHLPI